MNQTCSACKKYVKKSNPRLESSC